MWDRPWSWSEMMSQHCKVNSEPLDHIKKGNILFLAASTWQQPTTPGFWQTLEKAEGKKKTLCLREKQFIQEAPVVNRLNSSKWASFNLRQLDTEVTKCPPPLNSIEMDFQKNMSSDIKYYILYTFELCVKFEPEISAFHLRHFHSNLFYP